MADTSAIGRALAGLDAFMQRGRVRRALRKLFHGMREHHAAAAASAMAFDVCLAAIPMLALAGWVSAVLLQSGEGSRAAVAALLDVTPAQVQSLMLDQLGRLPVHGAAPLVLIVSLWLASNAFHTVMSVFETRLLARRRPWWKIRAIAIACVLVAFAVLTTSSWVAVALAGGPWQAFNAFRAGEMGLVGLIVVGAMTCLVAAFFRVAIERHAVKRRVWPGALLTVGITGAASWAFTAWVRSLANYTVYYGGLAAVAVAMVWLWLCCAALLLGAELNAQLEGVERATQISD